MLIYLYVFFAHFNDLPMFYIKYPAVHKIASASWYTMHVASVWTILAKAL